MHYLVGSMAFSKIDKFLPSDSLAHKKAWTVAGVLHGDISDNNIMIVFQGRRLSGILLDWDLCKYGEDLLRFKARNGKRSVSVS